MAGKKIVHVDSDILVIAGGFGGIDSIIHTARANGRDCMSVPLTPVPLYDFSTHLALAQQDRV